MSLLALDHDGDSVGRLGHNRRHLPCEPQEFITGTLKVPRGQDAAVHRRERQVDTERVGLRLYRSPQHASRPSVAHLGPAREHPKAGQFMLISDLGGEGAWHMSLLVLGSRRGMSVEALAREALERAVDYDDWFLREVETGLAEVDAGQTLTHEEVGERMMKKLAEHDARISTT